MPGTDGQKMSKSYGNTIEIFAEGKALEKAVMGIVTDKTPMEQPLDPEKCNVFALYKLFAAAPEIEALAAKYRGWRLRIRQCQEGIARQDRRLFRSGSRTTQGARTQPRHSRGGADYRRQACSRRGRRHAPTRSRTAGDESAPVVKFR